MFTNRVLFIFFDLSNNKSKIMQFIVKFSCINNCCSINKSLFLKMIIIETPSIYPLIHKFKDYEK